MIVFILAFFIIRNRRAADDKPEISYPNSIVPGNAVTTLNNNADGRTSTMLPDTDSDSEEEFARRRNCDSFGESSSEDEIEKIKDSSIIYIIFEYFVIQTSNLLL